MMISYQFLDACTNGNIRLFDVSRSVSNKSVLHICVALIISGMQYVTMIRLSIISLWLAKQLSYSNPSKYSFNASTVSFSGRIFVVLSVFGYLYT